MSRNIICRAAIPAAIVATIAGQGALAATYTDKDAFDSALAALGFVSSITADYDNLDPGTVLKDDMATVNGITHTYSGDPDVDLLVRDFPLGDGDTTNVVGSLLSIPDGDFPGALGFNDVVTFTTANGYRAMSLWLYNESLLDFSTQDVVLSFGGESLNALPGPGRGEYVVTLPDSDGQEVDYERRFFGIIAKEDGGLFNQGLLTFDTIREDFPFGIPIGEIDDVSFYNVSDVPPIPLPAGVFLLATGLLGFTALRRRG